MIHTYIYYDEDKDEWRAFHAEPLVLSGQSYRGIFLYDGLIANYSAYHLQRICSSRPGSVGEILEIDDPLSW
jgi:hypothetical protein